MGKSETTQKHRKRGEQIFRMYLQKYIKNRFESDEEKAYITKLIEASDLYTNMFTVPIPRWKYYVPLEKAERLNKKVYIELAQKGTENVPNDRWTYHLVVK